MHGLVSEVDCRAQGDGSNFKAGQEVARQGQRTRLPASFLEVNPLASQVSFKPFDSVDRLVCCSTVYILVAEVELSHCRVEQGAALTASLGPIFNRIPLAG